MSARKKRLVFTLIAVLFLGVFLYGYHILDRVDNIDIPKDDEDLGIDEDIVELSKDNNINNVVLFGIDKEGLSSSGARSDSVIIASIDRNNKVIKLTSLMRDTYIEIPGRGMDKLTHAYAYGGPELALKTINQNFKTDIREFITVDFTGFEQIIEAVGGVEIDITPEEAKHMGLASSGRQLLDGKTALEYSRIRKIGNDYGRTERQRTVLEEIFNKMTSLSVTSYPAMLNKLLPLVETSLSKAEMVSLGTDIIKSDIKNMEHFRLPVDGYLAEENINGVSYIVPVTLEDNVKFLRDFIHNENNAVSKNKN